MSQPGKGGLFGRPASSAQVEIFTGIQVSTSMYGQVIPYVAGRQRITYNLYWYGNFSAVQGSSPGKGGNRSSGSYIYSAAFLAGLCLGPIGGVQRVWHDKAIVDLEFENLSLSLGGSAPATWPFLSANFPAQAVPYDHVAYVATPSYNFGSSPSMPNLTFEVDGNPVGFDIPAGMLDADPSSVFTTYLQGPVIGAGFPGTIATLTGLTNSYQAYCFSLGLTTSPYENTQRAATDFVAELMQCTNSDVVLSVGTLNVKPYADQPVSGTTPDGSNWSYTPNLTPLFSFNDGDYCPPQGDPPVKLTRKAQSETHNIVNVEYLDRSNYYNIATVGASDLNDIALYGPRVMDTISLHQITNAQTAKMVAQLIMQADLYERNTLEWQTRADYLLPEPMDYVAVTDSNLGLVNQVVRLTEVTLTADYIVKFKGLEVPGVVRSTPQYNWDAAQGYFQNYAVSPGSVVPPQIFLMPPIAATDTQGIPIGIAVCGATANAFWGGCSVYVSVDGGSTYFFVGTVGAQGPARYGVTTTVLGAVPDPDTTSTLGIVLGNTNEQLQPVTDANADANQTLTLVDSGANVEVMSYGSAALIGAGTYNLSYLRRGLYGSSVASHLSGVPWVRLDGAIFQVPLDPGVAGQELFFKFTSFNIFGQAEEDISTVATYSYVVPLGAVDGGTHLVPRGSCAITGNTVYKSTQGGAAWDSDCVTSAPISGGQVFAKYGTGKNLAVGFVSSTASISDPTANMDFCWFVSGGIWLIAETGQSQGSFGAAKAGDVVQVTYDNVFVRYLLNGTQQRVVPRPNLSLFVAVAMFDPGDVFSPVDYTTLAATVPIGNFLSTASWQIGRSGSQKNYSAILGNGGGANAVVLAGDPSNGSPIGPYGQPEAIWRSLGGTAGAGPVGFIDVADLAGVDSTKTYRVCCWVCYQGSGAGTAIGGSAGIYFGCDDAAGQTTDLGGSTVDINPFFAFGPLANLTIGKWYLFVGIIHGSAYTGGQTGVSGLYDPMIADLVASSVGFKGSINNTSTPANGADFKFTSGASGQKIRLFIVNSTSSLNKTYFARPRFEEMNGHEPAIADLLGGVVDPSTTPAGLPLHAARHGVLPKGNVMPMVQNAAFTYTSDTADITWNWTGYLVFRPDGSSFNMSAGSQLVSGLSASTSYVSYAFSDEAAPSAMEFATTAGAVGTPAMAYPPGATYAQLTAALASASTLGLIFQGKLTGATTSSGSGGGGGGGGGFGCPHPDQVVLTSRGMERASRLQIGDELLTPDGWSPIVKLTRIAHHEWYYVEFNNRERVTVTGDHRFVAPDMEEIRANQLRIGQILKAKGANLQVVALRLREMDADCVSLELADPHLYFLTPEGPLSHNLKP